MPLKIGYHYYKERFSLIVWSLVSVLIVFLANLSFSSVMVSQFFVVLFIVFHLRLHDDLSSISFDKERGLERVYMKKENFNSLVIMDVFFFFICALLIWVFYEKYLALYIGFIFGCFVLYLLKNKTITFLLPLLKYPFLILLVARFRKFSCKWAIASFFLVVFNDLADNLNIKKKKIILLTFFITLVILKIVLEYL